MIPYQTFYMFVFLVAIIRKGRNIKVQLWDTAGQERYHSMTSSYYRGANGFIVLFDILQERSFRNCSFWWVKNGNLFARKFRSNCIIVVLCIV